MATKKRLSDVIRQEVQKLPDTEDKTAIDTTAVEVVENDKKGVEEATTAAKELPQDDDKSPNKAELEATIAELRAALEQSQKLEIAQQHEVSLQQQVIDLQAELSQQRELVQKLKKDLEEVNSLKSELKKTKKEALALAESNSKLIEENNQLKKDAEANSKPLEKSNQLKKEAEANSKPLAQSNPSNKEKEAITTRTYRPIERKIGKNVSENSNNPDDFANKTWLL